MACRRGTGRTQGRDPVELRLARIRQRARAHRKEPLNNLFSHLDGEMLLWAFERLEGGKAAGVDGVSVEEYGRGLEGRLASLLERLHRGSYRPQPSRRRWIPKGDGRQRPLGIPAIEDKIVQRALTAVLTEVYEEEFHDFSYGFRPGRGCHAALRALARHIGHGRVNWVVEADITGASSTKRPRSCSVTRMRHGAPGVSCSPPMKPSLSQRWSVEGATSRILAASCTVTRSPSGSGGDGSHRGMSQ